MTKIAWNVVVIGCLVGAAQFANAMQVQTISQITETEAFAKDSTGYMKNAIEHHLCLQKAQVISDILRTFTNDGPILYKNERRINLDQVANTLNNYSRDQIVAAEVVAFSQMVPNHYVGGRAANWLANVKDSQSKGNAFEESALLAVSPVIVFDTFVEIAFAGPMYLMDQAFNAMNHESCTPVADTQIPSR